MGFWGPLYYTNNSKELHVCKNLGSYSRLLRPTWHGQRRRNGRIIETHSVEDTAPCHLNEFSRMRERHLPVVSVAVPFLGYLLRILDKILAKLKRGTTMETTGKPSTRFLLWQSFPWCRPWASAAAVSLEGLPLIDVRHCTGCCIWLQDKKWLCKTLSP